MKRCKFIVFAALTAVVALAFFGCKNDPAAETPKEIELSFGSNSAYFTSQKKLLPISGEYPAEGDVYEQASVKLTAEPAAKLNLVLKLSEGQTAVPGLKIAVDGTVFDFAGGTVLFASDEAIGTKTLLITVFLSSTATSDAAGREIAFYFEMNA